MEKDDLREERVTFVDSQQILDNKLDEQKVE